MTSRTISSSFVVKLSSYTSQIEIDFVCLLQMLFHVQALRSRHEGSRNAYRCSVNDSGPRHRNLGSGGKGNPKLINTDAHFASLHNAISEIMKRLLREFEPLRMRPQRFK